jgi:hypothetical protein
MTRLLRINAAVAAVAALGCIAGLALDARTMLSVYLAASVAAIGVPIGALGVLMMTYLVPGRWTAELHPVLSRGALLLPFCALLMLPVLVGMKLIYPWVNHAEVDKPLQSIYLAPWFFILRTLVYFAVLSTLAAWAVRAYRQPAAMTRAASVGMIVYAVLVSFAGIDWLESIEPDFHSSIYGLLFLVIVLLTGLAFALAGTLSTARGASTSIYGPLLLAALLLWAYHHAMQYIIIWSGNLPSETIWYLERLRGGWGIALWMLFTLQFILPFMVLLSERARTSRKVIMTIAAGTLGLRFLETTVLVLPPLAVKTSLLWLDLPAAILLTSALLMLAWLARFTPLNCACGDLTSPECR